MMSYAHACVCVHVCRGHPLTTLKSVGTPPSMCGCIVWWVGGWVGELMGGIRSKHEIFLKMLTGSR